MLLDLVDLVIIVSDLLESLQALLVQQAESFSLSTFCVLTVVGLVLYACWVFTDVPNLPNPPQPPYVIQIRAGSNANANVGGDGRQNLSDVRLLSNGSLDTVLSSLPLGYSRLAQQQQQQQQNNADSRGSTPGEETNQNRALFFGFLRRPTTRSLIPIRPAVRSNFPGSNVVVYHHQVNVYHTVHPEPDGADRARTEASNRDVGNPPGAANGASSDNSNLEATISDSGVGGDTVPGILSQSTQIPTCLRHQHSESSPGQTNSDNQARVDDRNPAETTASCSSETNLDEADSASLSVSGKPEKSQERCVETNEGQTEYSRRNSTPPAENYSTLSPAGSAKTKPENVESSQNTNMSSRGQVGGGSTVSSAPQIPSLMEDDVKVTIKFLNDTQMDVTTQLKEKIADFKRRHFATELDENKIVRLIFNGRVLDNDGKTLRDFGVFDQCVMHCLIISPEISGRQPDTGNFNRAESSSNSRFPRSIPGGPEPGLFFVSILGVVLLFLWFICFHFGQQLFTQSAVISLVVLTAVFVIGLVALYLPVQPNH